MLKRNGCQQACGMGSEMCVECREVTATKGLKGDELWEAVLMLHN